MPIKINSLEFKTQTALHQFIDEIRTLEDDGEFDRIANASANFAVLEAIMHGRPKKRDELGSRKIVQWTRIKRGPNWSFDAILNDGTRLDMGVSKGDISEFVRSRQNV